MIKKNLFSLHFSAFCKEQIASYEASKKKNIE